MSNSAFRAALIFSISSLLFFPFCKNKNTGDTPPADALFEKIDPKKSGITFQNTLAETDSFNVLAYAYFYNGGGTATGDLDNDGLPDLVFTSNMGKNQLFKNKGNFQFEDMTDRSGIAQFGGWSTGVAMADVNGDGLLDLYICRSARAEAALRRNLLFINKGNFQFEEMGAAMGLGLEPTWTTHAVFFDFDRDGDLDLFEINHSTNEFTKSGISYGTARQQVQKGIGNRLFEQKNGRFADISSKSGIRSNVLTFSLGAAATDLTGDGWPDIYVGNDFNEHDYFFENQRDGTFKETSADHFRHVSHFTMGLDVADFNNDLRPDIFTLDMLPGDHFGQQMAAGSDNFDKMAMLEQAGFHPQSMRNMLQLNNGDGSFSEIGQVSGVSATFWSWAALFADFDLDGQKDIFVTNGYQRDYTNMEVLAFSLENQPKMARQDWRTGLRELLAKMPAIDAPNALFRNRGDLTFEDIASTCGFSKKDLSNGAAYADFDRDGDLDLVINNVNATADIYKNKAVEKSGNAFLSLYFKNKKDAIGARAILKTDAGSQLLELQPSRGFQSSVEPVLVFGLGKSVPTSLKIEWPDGSFQLIEKEKLGANRFLEIEKNTYAPRTNAQETEGFAVLPHFLMEKSGLGDLAGFVQKENFAQDFKVDFLLPWMLSAMGPRLAVGDANGDGLDDLWVGGAHESSAALFFQEKNGSFRRSRQPDFEKDSDSEDLEAVFFDADGDGDQDIFVASGGNEFEEGAEQLRPRLYLNDGRGFFQKSPEALPEIRASAQAVTAADFDQDGDVDVFLGGRLVAGKWPIAPRSFLLKNDGKGHFSDQTPADLRNPGMVTGAKWADLDSDNDLDLAVAGEWMPVIIFKNEAGNLLKTAVANSEGLWQCLETGDFDGDGDLDLAAGNVGLNVPFRAAEAGPMTVVAADFDGNGSWDPIMSYFMDGKSWPMPSRDDILAQLPGLKKQFLHYDDYARAGLTDFFDEKKLGPAFKTKAVRTLTSVLENDGKGGFSFKNLPIEAQFAPIFAISANGRDLILAGNLDKARVKFGRMDANCGLVLHCETDGNFKAIEPAKSGLGLRGEVRDIAKISTNQGEKWVFGINGQPLKIARRAH